MPNNNQKNKNHAIKMSDKYLFLERIGSGSFGEVYIAQINKGQNKGHKIAAKIENNNRNSKLLYEYKTYEYLRKNGFRIGIPMIYDFVENESYNMMFMQLLGPSLEDLFNKHNRTFNFGTIAQLAKQLITLMQTLHTAELIHRDIKPNNFLIGINDPYTVYIMDFGLSKRFIKNGIHMSFRDGKSLVGTARYASLNVHRGYEPSRRDDLESIGYMLVYFFVGKLPWQGLLKKPNENHIEVIGNCKMITPLEELCNGIPKCFYDYLKYCRQLEFEEQPDYDYLRKIFKDECVRMSIESYLEWCV